MAKNVQIRNLDDGTYAIPRRRARGGGVPGDVPAAARAHGAEMIVYPRS